MWITNRQWFRKVMSLPAGSLSRDALTGKLMIFWVALLVFIIGGCRAHPVSLATLIAGDAINDADVKDRRSKLMGQSSNR